MTILYDSNDHFKVIFSYAGTVWPYVLPMCIINSIITVALYYLIELDIVNLKLDQAAHKVMGVMVSFLVVSRTNTAYSRFWEARTIFGAALSDMSELSILAMSFTNADKSENADKWRRLMLDRIVKLIEATIFVLMDPDLTNYLLHNTSKVICQDNAAVHLPSSTVTAMTLHTFSRPTDHFVHEKEVNADPMVIVSYLHGAIALQSDLLQDPLIIHKEMRMHQLALNYLANYQELAKFSATPYPFPIAQMTRIFLCIWLFSLPLALVNSDPIPTTITIFFITFGFFGLEFVSMELDDPFGLDSNDIAMEKLSRRAIQGMERRLNPISKGDSNSSSLLQSPPIQSMKEAFSKFA